MNEGLTNRVDFKGDLMTIVKVKISADKAKSLVGNSDIKRFKALTDEQIREAAASDPDSVVTTENDLKEFTRAKHLGNGVYGHKKD